MRGDLSLEAVGEVLLDELAGLVELHEVPRLVHVGAQPDLQRVRQPPSPHQLPKIVEAPLEDHGARIQIRQDRDDRADDVGPDVADDEHARHRDEVLYLVLRRDVPVAHACECHRSPVVRQDVHAARVLRRVGHAVIAFRLDQGREPALLRCRVGDQASGDLALDCHPDTSDPVAGHCCDGHELEYVDDEEGEAVVRVQDLGELGQPRQASRLEEPDDAEEVPGSSHGGVDQHHGVPTRHHCDKVDPKPALTPLLREGEGAVRLREVRDVLLPEVLMDAVLGVLSGDEELHYHVHGEGDVECEIDEGMRLWLVVRRIQSHRERLEVGDKQHQRRDVYVPELKVPPPSGRAREDDEALEVEGAHVLPGTVLLEDRVDGQLLRRVAAAEQRLRGPSRIRRLLALPSPGRHLAAHLQREAHRSRGVRQAVGLQWGHGLVACA
mmetsp:Transcript_90688/g.228039  ORF Transcript_90688/g.228039 Transcript_90688/m.228039 type:complete len:439 (+) Transcript_90688:995-2311(+)